MSRMSTRTIPQLLSSYSSIASVSSHFPKFSLKRGPTSFFSVVSNPTLSPSALSYSSIATPTTSFVSHAVHRLVSFPSLSTRFIVIRRQFSSSSAVWTPQRVNKFSSLLLNGDNFSTRSDARHWLVCFPITGFAFDSEQALFDFYIKSLATVVGSEAEAKNKIYLVSVAGVYGFGAEFDRDTKNKLIDTIQMQDLPIIVFEDVYYGARKKDPKIQSSSRFTPVNWHRRLDNIFSYHHLSERNLGWNSDYWLINTKEPDGGFTQGSEIIDFCINLLADIVGSEKEAKERIYMIWLKLPFGFAAKVDGETLNKLKGMPDVLKVLPDYAFDVNISDDAIIIYPPSHGAAFSYHLLSEESDFKDCVSMESHVGPSCWRFNSKHWFIRMENPGGECASIQQSIDTYIKTLAIVIGSEEEAERIIYRVECEGTIFGFGAEIDVETSNKLKGMPGVLAILPDCIFNSSCKSTRFTPINRIHRLNDIYSYHHLSKCNWEWSSDHWLVHIRQPDCEVGSEQLTIDFCIQLLAKVVGSEKDAKEKIYMVWCKTPFGFGAEMDEKTLNKLKGLPDVLMVLPDYAFDIKNKDHGALVISPSSCLKPDSQYYLRLLRDIVDSDADEYDPN